MGWIGDTVEQCERMLETAAANGFRVGSGKSANKSGALEKRAKRTHRTLGQMRNTRDQIVALWGHGRLTQAEIALQVGCSKTTVSAAICDRGLSQRRSPRKFRPSAPDAGANNSNRNFDPKRGG